jgi:hypothetical protein
MRELARVQDEFAVDVVRDGRFPMAGRFGGEHEGQEQTGRASADNLGRHRASRGRPRQRQAVSRFKKTLPLIEFLNEPLLAKAKKDAPLTTGWV